MANIDSPFGLRPVGHLLGLPWTDKVRPYYVPSSYNTALFVGDPVVKIAAGSNTTAVKVPGVGVCPPGTLPQVNQVAAGGIITGVIVGFAADPDNLKLIHRPASTERVAFVCDDPFVIFEVQADDTMGAADVGTVADIVVGSGSATTGLSGVELDVGTAAAGSSAQLKILRIVNREDNDIASANAKWEVLINEHTMATGANGI